MGTVFVSESKTVVSHSTFGTLLNVIKPSHLLKTTVESNGVRSGLLVILDVNGALLMRVHRASNSVLNTLNQIRKYDCILNNRYIWLRPYLDPFLKYLLNRHSVGVWSSMQTQNVTATVNEVFHIHQCLPPNALYKESMKWDVGSLAHGLSELSVSSEQSQHKLEFVFDRLATEPDPRGPKAHSTLKNLSQVWKFKGGKLYSADTTVIIDDSDEKLRLQPRNLVKVPEFETEDGSNVDLLGDDALIWLAMYIELITNGGILVGDVREKIGAVSFAAFCKQGRVWLKDEHDGRSLKDVSEWPNSRQEFLREVRKWTQKTKKSDADKSQQDKLDAELAQMITKVNIESNLEPK